jgi:predicted Fe-Mo cluster-binding NifX family protein
MNICIPVTNDDGLDSLVCGHFGSAPFFTTVDTESRACRTTANANQNHAHGMCQPLAALAGQAIDGVVVGGIGMGALGKFQAAGIRVYRATTGTVGEAVDAFVSGTLTEITPATACAHHGHGDHGPHGAGPHGHGHGGSH